MGDRVLIQLKDKNEVSPVLYLHWGGTAAPSYIKEVAKLMRDRDDLSYTFARLVGIAHVNISGNLSVGVWNQVEPLTKNSSHGDAGCYLVDIRTWDVEAFGGYGEPFNATDIQLIRGNQK